MSVICIISDNYYFALGLHAQQPSEQITMILTLEQVLAGETGLEHVTLFYCCIRDRQAHLKVCQMLEGYAGRMVFFVLRDIEGIAFHPCFLSSRISLQAFNLVSQVALRRCNQRLSAAGRLRVHYASQGFQHYIFWISGRSNAKKTIHNQKRELLRSLGINRVNIHNLHLAEYLAAGLKATWH